MTTENLLKMIKNAFYFILEALFILKIFKFLSWLFAKLRAFRAYAPYVPTCLRASNYYVPTCLKLFTCLRALIIHVPTCLHSSRAYVLTTTHKIYWGSLLYFALLFFSGIFAVFDLSFHSISQNKSLLLKLHTSILSCGGFLFQLVHIQKQ